MPPIPCRIVNLPQGYPGTVTSRLFNHSGICLEVGPQPTGVVRANIVKMQRKAIEFGLDYLNNISKMNSALERKCGEGADIIEEIREIEIFCVKYKVDYPRDDSGNITAIIHPNLQVNVFDEILSIESEKKTL